MSQDVEAPPTVAPAQAQVPATPADGIPVESWLLDGVTDPQPRRLARRGWQGFAVVAVLAFGITGGVLAAVLWLAPMAFGALPVGCGGG